MNYTIVLETSRGIIELDVDDVAVSKELLLKHYIAFAKTFMSVVNVYKAYFKD